MADYEKMDELASEYGLQYVETTSARNGYPENIAPAIVGFNSFEDAENFAKEHGLDTWLLHKCDGWQLWNRVHSVDEPMSISCEDYGEDYNLYTAVSLENYFENEVKPCLENFDNIEDLRSFLDKQEMFMQELESLNDDEAVITYCGTYYERIKLHPMVWKHDTHKYIIGVM